MAALLSCGPAAVLSHRSAAALWGISSEGSSIEVTVPPEVSRRQPGIAIHRTPLGKADIARRHGLQTTAPARTLLDLARVLQRPQLEAAINEADKLGLTDPDSLRRSIDRFTGRPGVAALRRVLDRQTFVSTDSELERRFLPIARRAGLPLPETGVHLNGFKVDFYWPDLGLVVETDGLRYHRTPSQQARDRLRDQAHTAAGLTPLRFTHAQVRHEPGYVRVTLARVARRLGLERTSDT
jgi:very-short-patch-repair endonuclease